MKRAKGKEGMRHVGSLCNPVRCTCPCEDCSEFGICTPRTEAAAAQRAHDAGVLTKVWKELAEAEGMVQDPVNHPPHYTFGTIEVIDVLEDWQLPFHLANAVKYVARAGRKDRDAKLQDLRKAKWYLERYIKLREKQIEGGSDVRNK